MRNCALAQPLCFAARGCSSTLSHWWWSEDASCIYVQVAKSLSSRFFYQLQPLSCHTDWQWSRKRSSRTRVWTLPAAFRMGPNTTYTLSLYLSCNTHSFSSQHAVIAVQLLAVDHNFCSSPLLSRKNKVCKQPDQLNRCQRVLLAQRQNRSNMPTNWILVRNNRYICNISWYAG